MPLLARLRYLALGAAAGAALAALVLAAWLDVPEETETERRQRELEEYLRSRV